MTKFLYGLLIFLTDLSLTFACGLLGFIMHMITGNSLWEFLWFGELINIPLGMRLFILDFLIGEEETKTTTDD